MRIGRYIIFIGRIFWLQTKVPFVIKHPIPYLWILIEARPTDVDKNRKYPLGIEMNMPDGSSYRYYRKGG